MIRPKKINCFIDNKHVVLPYIRMSYDGLDLKHHVVRKQSLIIVYSQICCIFIVKFVLRSLQDEDLKWVEENIPSSMADV